MQSDHEERPHPSPARRLWPLLTIGAALLAAVFVVPKLRQTLVVRLGPKPFVREFLIFDTYARLTFWEASDIAETAAAEMERELRELHRTINVYDSESEIAKLNATAHLGPVACSDRLWDVVEASREAYRLSEGAFDVSIGPLMKLWGFHGKRRQIPSAEEIEAARRRVGLEKIVFDPRKKTVHFQTQGMFLDFGGIAKGYALDLCKTLADRHGLRRGIIDLGGDIVCLDDPPPGKKYYAIGIRHPLQTDQILDVAKVRGLAIATSGNYERSFVLDGQFVHHIVDPNTGWPVPNMASVTVVTPQGLAADVFSTAIFVGGEALIDKLLAQTPEARVITISAPHDSPRQIELKRYNWP